MAIYANPSYWEQDLAGEFNHVLVAVRYTGPSRRYSNNSAATQGRWPTSQDFLQGHWYTAFVPESTPDNDPGEGIAWFERSPDFEVSYDAEQIAEVLVQQYEGEIEAGGPIGDEDTLPEFDERVHEALGLEAPEEAGETYSQQIAELAGVPTEEVQDDLSPEEQLVQDYDREELKEQVKDEREDSGEFSLRGASMQDMAEFLVTKRED